MSICPRCGSENITFHREMISSEHSGSHDISGLGGDAFWGRGSSEGKSKHVYHTVALCQSCGYCWDKDRADKRAQDVQDFKDSIGCLGSLVAWGCVIGVVLAILYFTFQGIFWLVDPVKYAEEKAEKERVKALRWAEEYTPLKELEYKLEDGELTITNVKLGAGDTLWFASSYEVDGKEYPVRKIDREALCDSKFKSVILPEGIEEMHFYETEVSRVFVPASFTQTINDWSRMDDLQEIFYGGTEEMFEKLVEEGWLDYGWEDLEDITVFYNAVPEELEALSQSIYEEEVANDLSDVDMDAVAYPDARSLERALNVGHDPTGRIAKLSVKSYRGQSGLGINTWAGRHLNCITKDELDVSDGDIITVRITERPSKVFYSWKVPIEVIDITHVEK